ncbi:MAG: DNA gyrase subunit A, partial [Abditibacteriota bacterium]|nr:DNA gyrase subunit A [Abditibacteriota bacterium]
ISRALPDVRDGLKPVQRRILAAMNDLNLVPSSPHRKSAKIAGDTSGNYHPHGEAIIYPTMVRMAQVFNARYPLIDAQGNMGSIDGDPPAAMRYTEMRMSQFAVEMLSDLEKDTVEWGDNYDQTRREPLVLPSRIPNLLANGSSGIAVGMATNIPPHNLKELCDGLIYLIDHPDSTTDDLMQFIKGPDFPTAGLILGSGGIKKAYDTGHGSITMQAMTTIERMDNGREAIIVTELPYQVNKTTLIEKIARLAKDRKIDGIADIPDYSDRNGMRIQIELKKDAKPKKILNFLYKHTDLRKSFGVIMLALVNGAPQILTLKQMLSHYLEHRIQVITRKTKFELRTAMRRAHIVEGLVRAIDNIDEIISIIRNSSSAAAARESLMEWLNLSWQQATAILDMQLRQLAGLERAKLEEEYLRLLKSIAAMEDLLSSRDKLLEYIKKDLALLKEQSGDERQTRIINKEAAEIGEDDLVPIENNIVTITKEGYIKRMLLDTFRSSYKTPKGKLAIGARELDKITDIFTATTANVILFFSDKGKVYKLKTFEIPQATNKQQGTAIINLIGTEPEEKITASVVLENEDQQGYLVMATAGGEVKRCHLKNFRSIRSNGIQVFEMEPGDVLRWAAITRGEDEIILVTKQGIGIRFSEKDVRASGRTSGGVRGIKLSPDDIVVGMTLATAEGKLLCVTENGYGKQTDLSEYRLQARGGKGVKTFKCSDKTGLLVNAVTVNEKDTVLVAASDRRTIRIKIKDIRETGRSAQGLRIIQLDTNKIAAPEAKVVSIERLPSPEALQKQIEQTEASMRTGLGIGEEGT